MRSINKIVVLLLLGALSSCTTSTDRAFVGDVDALGWCLPVEFNVDVVDTISMVDIQIMVRYHTQLQRDTVALLVATTAPSGTMWCERVSIVTPPIEAASQIIHSGYRGDVVWPESGHYTIAITPTELYRGISAVGIEIQTDR